MPDRDHLLSLIDGLSITQREKIVNALKNKTVPRATELSLQSGDPYMMPTPAQAAMWLHTAVHPGSTSYHVNILYSARDLLDFEALKFAIEAVAIRHDALRLVFRSLAGSPRLEMKSSSLPHVARIEETGNRAEEFVLNELRSRAVEEFDLSSGPLFRAYLGDVNQTKSYLLLSLHHAVCDGGSIGILLKDIGTLYYSHTHGEKVDLAAPSSSFVDFVRWQTQWLSGDAAAGQANYWKTRLRGAVPGELPPTYRRPPVPSLRGARLRVDFGEQWMSEVEKLARERRTTSFAVLTAVLALLIGRYAGQDDVTIGAPFEGRSDSRFENSVGSFINPLPLRVQMRSGMTFVELLAATHQEVVAALANQDLPFDRILEVAKPARDPSRSPLFQVFLNRFSIPETLKEFEGLTAATLGRTDIGSKFDLSIYSGANGSLAAVYSTDLYDEPYIETFLKRLVRLAGEATASPEMDIAAFLEPAKSDIADHCHVSSSGHESFVANTVSEQFLAIADRFQERPAIYFAGNVTTYRQLRSLSLAIAHGIVARKIAPQSAVAVFADNGVDAIAGQLGALLANCHFVPLDPSSPSARLEEIALRGAVRMILFAEEHRDIALALERSLGIPSNAIQREHETADLPLPVGRGCDGDKLAYVLFTSGTTGIPKGVMQSERNLLTHIHAYVQSIRVTPQDRLTQFSWFGFDGAIMDVYASLITGACLLPFNLRKEGIRQITERLVSDGATIFHSTPTVYRHTVKHLRAAEVLVGVRAVVLGGEEATHDDWTLFCEHFAKGTTFVNGYGPSESTTATQHHMTHDSIVPAGRLAIGKPVSGTTVTVVDDKGQRVGLMARGEIVIESARLALGYLDDEKATNAAFITSLRTGSSRSYRTGDIGRYIDDKVIEFVGRRDDQVKIRGIRVELGEIRAALQADPNVAACAVVMKAQSDRIESQLVAYYTARRVVSTAVLQSRLRDRLPEYMIPRHFVVLDEIPLRPNGKLDESRLPLLELTLLDASGTAASPLTSIESQVQLIWREVLGVAHVASDVNFFDAGGHSLLLMEVHARLQSAGYNLPLIEMFQFPTIRLIAETLSKSLAVAP